MHLNSITVSVRFKSVRKKKKGSRRHVHFVVLLTLFSYKACTYRTTDYVVVCWDVGVTADFRRGRYVTTSTEGLANGCKLV